MKADHKKMIVIIVFVGLAILYGVFLFLNRSPHDGPGYYDGVVKANLSGLSTEGEFYREISRPFTDFCAEKGEFYGSAFDHKSSLECYDSEDAWAAGAILPYQGAYFCVDSAGTRYTTTRG